MYGGRVLSLEIDWGNHKIGLEWEIEPKALSSIVLAAGDAANLMDVVRNRAAVDVGVVEQMAAEDLAQLRDPSGDYQWHSISDLKAKAHFDQTAEDLFLFFRKRDDVWAYVCAWQRQIETWITSSRARIEQDEVERFCLALDRPRLGMK